MGAAVVQQQRPARQPGRRQARRGIPVGRHHGQHRVAAPGLDAHAGQRRLRQRDQPQVQRAGGQPRQRLGRGRDADLQVDAGMPARQLAQRGWQQVGDRAGAGAEPHTAALTLGMQAHVGHQLVQIGQQPARPRGQHLPGAGGCHAPATQQQGHAEARLEFGHMLRHRRRRQVQRPRRLREAAQLGHGQQRAQAIQVDLAHRHSIRRT